MWFLGPVLKFFTGGGASGLAEQFRLAQRDRLEAKNDSERLAAEERISQLNTALASQQITAQVHQAAAGFWEMRLIVFIAGFPTSLHFAAVNFVSTFPQWGWVVQKLPEPMDSWQQSIILSLFGVSAGISLVKVGAAAIMGRR